MVQEGEHPDVVLVDAVDVEVAALNDLDTNHNSNMTHYRHHL